MGSFPWLGFWALLLVNWPWWILIVVDRAKEVVVVIAGIEPQLAVVLQELLL